MCGAFSIRSDALQPFEQNRAGRHNIAPPFGKQLACNRRSLGIEPGEQRGPILVFGRTRRQAMATSRSSKAS
jgi:hypothetical protein